MRGEWMLPGELAPLLSLMLMMLIMLFLFLGLLYLRRYHFFGETVEAARESLHPMNADDFPVGFPRFSFFLFLCTVC